VAKATLTRDGVFSNRLDVIVVPCPFRAPRSTHPQPPTTYGCLFVKPCALPPAPPTQHLNRHVRRTATSPPVGQVICSRTREAPSERKTRRRTSAASGERADSCCELPQRCAFPPREINLADSCFHRPSPVSLTSACHPESVYSCCGRYVVPEKFSPPPTMSLVPFHFLARRPLRMGDPVKHLRALSTRRFALRRFEYP